MTIAWRCKNGSRAETSPRRAPEAGLQGKALPVKQGSSVALTHTWKCSSLATLELMSLLLRYMHACSV